MNWFYVLNGQQNGPVSEAQLDELARAGTVKADTLVWAEGMPNWVPYSQARQPSVPGQLQSGQCANCGTSTAAG